MSDIPTNEAAPEAPIGDQAELAAGQSSQLAVLSLPFASAPATASASDPSLLSLDELFSLDPDEISREHAARICAILRNQRRQFIMENTPATNKPATKKLTPAKPTPADKPSPLGDLLGALGDPTKKSLR